MDVRLAALARWRELVRAPRLITVASMVAGPLERPRRVLLNVLEMVRP